MPAAIRDLAKSNPPRQLDLLLAVANVLQVSPFVSHLLVRGSLAAGASDESSDIDLVIAVQEPALTQFCRSLDTLIKNEVGALFPGWRDAIAPGLGGIGVVYLIPFRESLYELDIYLVSERRVCGILESGAKVIFSGNISADSPGPSGTSTEATPAAGLPAQDVARSLVVEMLVILHLLSKQLTRRQCYIVYGHMSLLNDAVRRLIKHRFAPHSRSWGWYHLEKDVGAEPAAVACLRELAALIKAPLVRGESEVRDTFVRIERVIDAAAPEVAREYEWGLTAYRHYMGFL